MCKAEQTINKATTYVIKKECEHLDGLLDKYNLAQQERNDAVLDTLLDKITAESKRLDPKDKYDEEELRIALIIHRRRKKK